MGIHHNKGFTLVELAIACTLAGMAMAVGLFYQAQQVRYDLARSQAQQLLVLNAAVNDYISRFRANLVNSQPIPGFANPQAPTVGELESAGLLQSTFSANNYYLGGYRVALSLQPAACSPSTCQVFGLSYLTSAVADVHNNVDQAALGEAMQTLGGDGAFSTVAAPTMLAGPLGSWSATNPLGAVAGILAVRSGYSAQNGSLYLRIDGSNAMAGSLNLGNQDVVNGKVLNAQTVSAQTVTAQDANVAGTITTGTLVASTATINGAATVKGNSTVNGTAIVKGRLTTQEYLQLGQAATAGTACGPNGLLTQDANGAVLSCLGGQWTQAAGAPRMTQVAGGWGCNDGPRDAWAMCPAGMKASGCGYQLVAWWGGTNSPDAIAPTADNQGCHLYSGGAPHGCFQPIATCIG